MLGRIPWRWVRVGRVDGTPCFPVDAERKTDENACVATCAHFLSLSTETAQEQWHPRGNEHTSHPDLGFWVLLCTKGDLDSTENWMVAGLGWGKAQGIALKTFFLQQNKHVKTYGIVQKPLNPAWMDPHFQIWDTSNLNISHHRNGLQPTKTGIFEFALTQIKEWISKWGKKKALPYTIMQTNKCRENDGIRISHCLAIIIEIIWARSIDRC